MRKKEKKGLVDLELTDAMGDSTFSLSEDPFKNILGSRRQKIEKKEFEELQQAAQEMDEAQVAFDMMMRFKDKLIHAYQNILKKA
jgi:Flagellar hook-basal body complex protein FliE